MLYTDWEIHQFNGETWVMSPDGDLIECTDVEDAEYTIDLMSSTGCFPLEDGEPIIHTLPV